MAKSKKNIDAFQEAMLSNTKMIKANEGQSKNKTVQQKTTTKSSGNKAEGLKIDPNIYKKLEDMSKKYNIDKDILITKGLSLFISLEDYWFTKNETN